MQTNSPTTLGNFNILKPRKALNKAFLKLKPNRYEIEQFNANLIQLLDRTNQIQQEVEFTYFDIRNYEKSLRNKNPKGTF